MSELTIPNLKIQISPLDGAWTHGTKSSSPTVQRRKLFKHQCSDTDTIEVRAQKFPYKMCDHMINRILRVKISNN